MQLLTHVTFLAPDFDEPAPHQHADDGPEPARAKGEPRPPGADMARLLDGGLAAKGWEVLNRWTTPYGHAFDVKRTNRRYDVETQLIDGDTDRFLVTAVERRGLVRWFKRPSNSDEHALLLTHLRGLLASDSRLHEPRWYSEDEWTAADRGPGHDVPIGR